MLPPFLRLEPGLLLVLFLDPAAGADADADAHAVTDSAKDKA